MCSSRAAAAPGPGRPPLKRVIPRTTSAPSRWEIQKLDVGKG